MKEMVNFAKIVSTLKGISLFQNDLFLNRLITSHNITKFDCLKLLDKIKFSLKLPIILNSQIRGTFNK